MPWLASGIRFFSFSTHCSVCRKSWNGQRGEQRNTWSREDQRWSPFVARSTEEIFALFVSIAFLVDASTHVYQSRAREESVSRAEHRLSPLDFSRNYLTTACKQYDDHWKLQGSNSSTPVNVTGTFLTTPCTRDISLLYILLTLGTVWLGTFLYKFKQTPYLTSAKRELLTDYALPVSVIIMSLVGSLLFSQINRKIDAVTSLPVSTLLCLLLVRSFSVDRKPLFVLVRFKSVTLTQVIVTGFLGFSLSLLMFLVSAHPLSQPILSLLLLLGSEYRWCYCQFSGE